MLKSLEKLREGICFPVDPETGKRLSQREGIAFADEIQHEIDRFYLPRPLFEDGEPADFGMEFVTGKGFAEKIKHIDFYPECVEINLCGAYTDWTYREDHPLRRPSEPDTQEQIDADAKLSPFNYVRKFGLEDSGGWSGNVPTMLRHLLARQRKLDGVE